MKSLFLLIILAATVQLLLAAPKGLSEKEKEMLSKLHKPWHTVDLPPEHPRKGEYKCKSGICKTKKPCNDCQGPVPLDTNWEYIR